MQAGGRTDPMGCRIFRSKRAAVFETGSGNRSVRNAQYAYGRAAGSRKNHDLRADGYNPAATYKKRAAGGFKNIQCLRSAGRLPDTVAGTAVSQSASYGQHGRACRRWTKYPAGRRFHWHIMVCFFWMNSRNFPNQRWKCCVSRWRNIRFI